MGGFGLDDDEQEERRNGDLIQVLVPKQKNTSRIVQTFTIVYFQQVEFSLDMESNFKTFPKTVDVKKNSGVPKKYDLRPPPDFS